MPKNTTLEWKSARPKISRLDSALSELDFEYPTIKSRKTPDNSTIQNNSNHNNRQSYRKPAFSNCSSLKSVFEKLRFPLVWLCFQISLAKHGHVLNHDLLMFVVKTLSSETIALFSFFSVNLQVFLEDTQRQYFIYLFVLRMTGYSVYLRTKQLRYVGPQKKTD